MLPMAMHQKQDRVKRKHKSSTSRSGRQSLDHTFSEESLKPGSYSLGSSALFENLSDVESGAEPKKLSCTAVMISNPKSSRVGSLSRNLSVTIDHTSTNMSDAKKSIDMRPLSVPPREIKRTSPKQSCCYVALGIATLVVCGIAFTIWLTYDSLEDFFSSIMH